MRAFNVVGHVPSVIYIEARCVVNVFFISKQWTGIGVSLIDSGFLNGDLCVWEVLFRCFVASKPPATLLLWFCSFFV